jgi:hypothetical protein
MFRLKLLYACFTSPDRPMTCDLLSIRLLDFHANAQNSRVLRTY